MNSTGNPSRCYVFDESDPYAWGQCCDELGIVPKPLWMVLLLSLPIEAVVAASDIHATAAMYERKSDQTALILLAYNLVSLGLIAYEFEWTSCEATATGAFECYQGVLFMFYNSTAALASMTLWMLILLRKFYPHWYSVTRFFVFPNMFWRWFDEANFPLRGTKEVVRIWYIISKSTGLFWYNIVGMIVTLLFGGGSHVLPMFFAYPFIFFSLWLALLYAHTVRIGYVSKSQRRTFQATILAIICFYPAAMVVSLTFFAVLPLNIVLAPFSSRSYSIPVPPRDVEKSDLVQLVIEESSTLKFTVDMHTADSLYDLKLAILEALGFAKLETTDIYLTYEERLLINDSYTLKEYKIETGATIGLSKKSQDKPKIQLCDKLLELSRKCCKVVSEWLVDACTTCYECWDDCCSLICPCCKPLIEEEELRLNRQIIIEHRMMADRMARDSYSRQLAAYGREPEKAPAKSAPRVKHVLEEESYDEEAAKAGTRIKAISYIRDALRNLCLFDANGKVILFASATTFITFTLAANYGILLYTGANYLQVPLVDFHARRSEIWFECAASNFTEFDAFGILDFLGLAVGVVAAFLQLADFISTIA